MKLRKPCGHKDRQGNDLYDKHAIFEVGIHIGWCPGGEFLTEDTLTGIAWQFNEAVSLLREARGYAPDGLGEDIDNSLPLIQLALKEAAALAALAALAVREGEG